MSCKYNNIFLYIKERTPNISKDLELLRNALLVFMLVVEVAEVDFVADVASSHRFQMGRLKLTVYQTPIYV